MMIATKKGYLTKQGKRWKNWKRRWFILKDKQLYYFKVEGDDRFIGQISLVDAIVLPAEETTKRRFSFEIYHPGRQSFFACADTKEQLEEWMEAFQRDKNSMVAKMEVPSSTTPQVLEQREYFLSDAITINNSPNSNGETSLKNTPQNSPAKPAQVLNPNQMPASESSELKSMLLELENLKILYKQERDKRKVLEQKYNREQEKRLVLEEEVRELQNVISQNMMNGENLD
eukprot:TRINITY_DN10090_c0_g1_i1.p1 TRINITY_DN10090_c0_g1~~TRINITY_DN10090_c0_g1_i1.p1  ORF type:complete len:230 (-),score=59.08 TRINITY_DN10090_c0_g1_i1:244-933(-)